MKPTYDDYLRYSPPQRNDGAWHYVEYEARQSGRTWRMMQEARRLWEAGAAVYIVVHNRNYAADLRHRYRVPLSVKIESIAEFEDMQHFVLNNSADLPHPRAHPNCVVLVDPSLIEMKHRNLLRHYHRFDGTLPDNPAPAFGEWERKKP